MSENKATSSIARRINLSFWLGKLSTFLSMDALILLLLVGSFFYWHEAHIPESENVTDRYFESGSTISELQYVILTDAGAAYIFSLGEFILFIKYPAIINLIIEGIELIKGLFKTRDIRRIMKPLNEIAKKAEELGSIAFDSNKFQNLENAISNIKPTAPDARLETGDKDLYSLEVAINNLLERMRESYRQQNRFVSDASHELRTPIAVVQGYVNMLDRWGKEDESILDESIEALKNESRHMQNLVEQLLFLARGDSGRNHLKMEKLALTDIVGEVYEESMMIDENHKYQFHGEERVEMLGDIAMLKQSVRIFTDNAAKYSREGDTITLSVKKQGKEVWYCVQDEGVGMAESDVIHVFERFYRSDSARNSKTGGSGLGLSIAKWIVDAHGGVIEVLSRPELGTRFTIKLPILINS